jgi:hypothetical protein
VKPIIFNTVMVRAILDERKTQTRRIVKPQPTNSKETFGVVTFSTCSKDIGCFGFGSGNKFNTFIKPPYQVGEILWVRETWAQTWTPCSNDTGFVYKADGEPPTFPYWGNASQCKDEVWIPSIHMPREAARIFLKVTNVRVERLQDISEEDAKAEGIYSYWAEPHRDGAPFIGASKEIGADLCCTRIEAFSQKWDSIYGNWMENPWAWVIEFEKVDKP